MQPHTPTIASLGPIVRDHYKLVFGTALAVSGDAATAEDITQETFVVFWRRRETLRDPEALPSFLRGIARNLSLRELRRRRYTQTHLPRAFTELAPPTPEAMAETKELTALALRAVASLPRPQRDAVVLFYLHECSQREVAGFLNTSVTRVNNLLHAARQKLKGRTLNMVKTTLQNISPSDDFIENIGRILEVRGPVVEAHFERGRLPDYADPLVLNPAEENPTHLTVIQRLKGGRLRCITTGGEPPKTPGGKVTRGAWAGGSEVHPGALRTLLDVVAPRPESPNDAKLVETGIKVIDLLAPITRGGRIGLVGPMGAGRMVLITELCERLEALGRAGRVSLMTFIGNPEAESITGMRRYQDEPLFTEYNEGVLPHIDTFYLPTRRGGDPALLDPELFDTTICLDMIRAVEGNWPAVDTSHSGSRLLDPAIVGPAHAEVAAAVRESVALAQRHSLLADPELLKHIANGAFGFVRAERGPRIAARLAQLEPGLRLEVERGRKLDCFLSTPFFCAEAFSGIPGEHVALADTLEGCRAILAGACDEVEESALHMIGSLKGLHS